MRCPEKPLHLVGYTKCLVKSLVRAPTGMGNLLRIALHSADGRRGDRKGSRGDPYPLPMPPECAVAIRLFAEENLDTMSPSRGGMDDARRDGLAGPRVQRCGKASRPKISKMKKASLQSVTTQAWWGLLVFGLNSSRGFTTRTGESSDPLKKEVLDRL